MRLLLVKATLPEISDLRTEPLPNEILWLDRLCNGLLSRCRYHGRFPLPSKAKHQPLLWVLPACGDPSHVFLWVGAGPFPWQDIAVAETNAQDRREFFYAGEFRPDELEQGRKILGGIAPWNGTADVAP